MLRLEAEYTLDAGALILNCHSMVTVPIEADCSMDAWGIVYN
ncbi:hypothetical protein SynPROSU1_02082 [Synechococcus sp. PROS-U-1]|nr:hypothetical protein SynPROSU1_02082 [Synechococcus sp. PROS-U-1]